MSKELDYIQRQIDIVKQQVKGSKVKFLITDPVTKHQYDYYENELQVLESIEKALLKAQEPKQYLKWDNLEFSYGTKTQKVRMGDTLYKIAYVCYDNTKEVQLLSEDEKLLYFVFVGKYKDNVQLFNDLKLERVEE